LRKNLHGYFLLLGLFNPEKLPNFNTKQSLQNSEKNKKQKQKTNKINQ
jgi:hypothetical protein